MSAVIPAEAVEAAAKVHYRSTGDIAVDADEWMTCCRDAQKALEAAAPHMLADAWDRGHHDGAVDQMLHMENDGAKTTPNPYRPVPNPDIGPRCPECRVGLGTHDTRDPHCIDYRPTNAD